MPIEAAFMVPHPPMIVPAVGRGSEERIRRTTESYQAVARRVAEIAPDTIIITSPHSVMYADYFHISPGKGAKGSFADFRAPKVRFDEDYDSALVQEICRIADKKGFPAGTLGERDRDLDHGTMVPLYFIRQETDAGKIVRIGLSGLPLTMHYELGQMIREAVDRCGRRAVFIASGDLSHKLQTYGPYGYAPEGPEYDARIMDVMGRAAFGELLEFDEVFCEKAAECGHRSFVIMAGAFDGENVAAEAFSHEDVTGVGYGICAFRPVPENSENVLNAGSAENTDNSLNACQDRRFLTRYLKKQMEILTEKRKKEDSYVSLARRSLESYILQREVLEVPADIPAEMKKVRAGAFVSIHEHGKLRGCIGTTGPTTSCVAEEIIQNAVSASTRDPRFDPIEASELPWLEISVDVLGDPEEIASKDDLDVKRYGVIVTSGGRRGLLLPDLDGVDTVEDQISIAMQKAGIRKGEKIRLQRFEVVRHT